MTSYLVLLEREVFLKAKTLKSLTIFFIALGFFLRFYYVLVAPVLEDQIWSDMQIYMEISKDISAGIWKENHFFQSIGYPLFIHSMTKISDQPYFLLSILQSLASCAILFIVYHCSQLAFGNKIALITLLISSIHLPWIYYSNFALPELFFTFFLAVCCWLSLLVIYSQNTSILLSLLWGFFFILAFWLKGTHALWGPLFLLGLIMAKGRRSIKPAIAICIVVTLGLLAHGALTYSTIGKFKLSAATSGLNFIEGKCPDKKNIDSLGRFWLSPLYYQLDLTTSKTWNRPFADSHYFFQQGIECIKKDPFVLIQSLESIPFLFMGNTMWPFNSTKLAQYSRLHELFFAIFIIIGLGSYLIHLKKNKNFKEAIVWVLPIFSLFLCVYIFKSEIRYRVPFDVWFIPISVKGWAELNT